MWEIFIGIMLFTAVWGSLKLASFIQDIEDVQSNFDRLQSTVVQVLKVMFSLMGVAAILAGFIITPHVLELSISLEQNASNFNQTSLTIINDLTQGYEDAWWSVLIVFTFVNLILLLAVIFFVYTDIGVNLMFGKGRKPGITGLPKK